ncbi:MAG: hypothetical protein HQL13_07590, partial [Candidatus Omnitrophica bacterium]|nr:hypothetical protein [Candidatus Omnitrophota bacterium]
MIKTRNHLMSKILCWTLSALFCFSPAPSFSQSLSSLPLPGSLLLSKGTITPLLLKGLHFSNIDKPEFKALFDSGTDSNYQDRLSANVKEATNRQIKYFFAALTIPEEDLWVNLSPYEATRIITPSLGHTQLGRDMLAQDYLLKQFTSSLFFPNHPVGKKFWREVYRQIPGSLNQINIPVNALNKVWIMPERAVVYDHGNSALIIESKLQVMLDSDYLASRKTVLEDGRFGKQHQIAKQIFKDIILPVIDREINEGKNFERIRQIFNAIILAKWYRQKAMGHTIAHVYFNSKKTAGIDIRDKKETAKIYARYVQAFKKGSFNFIEEDFDPLTKTRIPRKYFSGGLCNL